MKASTGENTKTRNMKTTLLQKLRGNIKTFKTETMLEKEEASG